MAMDDWIVGAVGTWLSRGSLRQWMRRHRAVAYSILIIVVLATLMLSIRFS